MSPNSLAEEEFPMDVASLFVRRTDEEQYTPVFIRSFVAAMVVLFALTHAPVNFVLSWYDRCFQVLLASGYISQETFQRMLAGKDDLFVTVIGPVRNFLLFISIVIVGTPLVGDIRRHIRMRASLYSDLRTYTPILIPLGILCLFVFPTQLGLGGFMYSRMTLDPMSFNDGKLWFYQRLLMPSIAYFLQMKGTVLYLIFSLGVTALMFLLVHLFFVVRGVTLSRLELVSLGTSSFLMTQLQIPGYTEQLAIIFLLLLFIVPFGTMGRLSLVILSLLAHEVSIVPLLFISYRYFSKEEQWMVAAVIVFYCFFWIASFGGDVSTLLAVRNVYGKSGWQWAVEHPLRLLSGIALSFKLLWIIILYAIMKFPSVRTLIAGFTVIAILFTLIGTDTSRLMGFGLIGLLLAVYMLKGTTLAASGWYRGLLLANIVVPTFFIGTNIGIALVNGFYDMGGVNGKVIFNGLYQIVYLGVVMR